MARKAPLLREVRPHYGDVQNFIGGEWRPPSATEWLENPNPATGGAIARVPLSPKEDVDAAVDAAMGAWDAWRATPPQDRARYFFRLRALLEAGLEDISRVIVQDMGKTIDEARGEVLRAIEDVEVAAGIPNLQMGYNLEDGAGVAGMDEEVLVQPLGVFAGISPFNFPVMVQFWFWPYAVATGNCWVAKPSEQDPLAQVLVFDLIKKAGFPPGVVNLVNGARETVEAILDHPDIKGVSFVGSTPVAKIVYARAAARGKRVQCGGGAKNLLVVLPDAKLDRSIPNMINSFYGCAGQRCLAGSAILALGDARDAVREKFTAAASRIRVGYGLDESVEMGPVISRKSMERIAGFVGRAEEEGADTVLDGRDVKVPGYPGYFVGPTVLDGVTGDMAISKDEVFGPVATFMEAEDLDGAIEAINRSPFGNAASIYTSSGKAAREFRTRARAGNVGVNVGVVAPIASFPFSGMKDSFLGDLHPQGRDAIRFFTESKVVITRWF